MKVLRFVIALITILAILILQACGGGSGAGSVTDTSGNLKLTKPATTNNSDNTYSVATTVTYDPPAGKTAQGVVVNLNITYNSTIIQDTITFNSGSNSVDYSFIVPQNAVNSTHVSIVASIGGMKSSSFAIIPAISPVTGNLLVDQTAYSFTLASDFAGSQHTFNLNGGVGTYSVASVVYSGTGVAGDLVVNTSTSGLNPNGTSIGSSLVTITIPRGLAATATVTIKDQSATPKTVSFDVVY